MRCPRCQASWPDELAGVMKFCGACGAPLVKPSRGEVPTQPLSFSQAVSFTADPGGELRTVTVLFADLANFTAYAEDRRPDVVARIIGDLLQRLGEVVERHGGGVDKFLGDAVVATFGLPRPDPNAARNAVRAGMEMQACAAEFFQEQSLNLGLRVGIHAGEVMFRALRGSWTVMGDTVNTASRIQSAATPGKVWLSRPVYEEVRRYFTLIPRPAVDLKGKRQTIQPYEVVDERKEPFTNLPRFVGREAEFAQMKDVLARVVADQTMRLLVVRGPAGVGKSRMVWELRDWIQKQTDLYWVDLAQYDHSERLPSHGLNSLVRGRFNLPLELDEQDCLDGLKARMHEEYPSDPEREALRVEFFAYLLGISRPEFLSQNIDGRSRWEAIFIEMKGWMEHRAAQMPWVWFIEDAQKGDADTAAYLDWALRMPWSQPVLVVVTVREEDFSPDCFWYAPLNRWIQEGKATEIRLREIPPEKLALAVRSMLEDKIPPSLARRIAEHTEGNPLFATEIVLLLKERGLELTDETWEKLSLPYSIREVMEARIERLGQDGKEVAKRGAMMGRRFTQEAVRRLWERPLPEMETGYTVLRETETTYEEASKLFTGEMEDVFRHGRLHEAVLRRIPGEERIRWLKELEGWARLKLDQLGSHWMGAGTALLPLIASSKQEQGLGWEASLWFELLGHLHNRFYRSHEAAQAFRSALEGAMGARGLVLCRLVAELDQYNGQSEAALSRIESNCPHGEDQPQPVPDELAQRLYPLMSDPLDRWDQLSHAEAAAARQLARARILTEAGDVEQAREAYLGLEQQLSTLHGLVADRLWLRWGRAWSYFLSELLADSTAAAQVCNSIRQQVPFGRPELASDEALFLASECLVAYHLGRFEQVETILEERLRLSQARRDLRDETTIYNMRGILAQSQGSVEAGKEFYRHSLEVSRSIGFRRAEVISLHNLGATCADQGDWEKSLAYEEEYLTMSRETGNRLAEAYAPCTMGSVYLGQGDIGKAAELVQKALAISVENGWQRAVEMCRAAIAHISMARWLEDYQPMHLEEAIANLLPEDETAPLEDSEDTTILVIALYFTGRKEEARHWLDKACREVDEKALVDKNWLDLTQAFINGASLEPALDWFRQNGLKRAANFCEKLAKVL